jgi:LysM repeat protein
MDTISHESNSSYLPVAGVLVGVIALIVSGAALYKASAVGKRIPDGLQDRLTNVESATQNAAASADKANGNLAKLQSSVQAAFENQIGPAITSLQASVTKLEDAAKAHPAPKVAAGKKGEASVAGPGEYVVKPGDNGMKISRATGASLSQLEAANPGINWRHLHIGQVIKTGAK